jgi:hypothetical protein
MITSTDKQSVSVRLCCCRRSISPSKITFVHLGSGIKCAAQKIMRLLMSVAQINQIYFFALLLFEMPTEADVEHATGIVFVYLVLRKDFN